MRGDTIETPASPDRSLSFLWLELTNSCSLQCLHCYSESAPGSGSGIDVLDTTDYVAALEEARSLGCEGVQFIGGEPTLFHGLPVLLDHAARLEFPFVEVFTNAIRLTDSVFDAIVRNKVRVATSLYSPDGPTHDAITRRAGSHAATSHNVRRLVAAGVPMRAGFVEMDENQGAFDSVAAYARSLGIDQVGHDRVRGVGRGAVRFSRAAPATEVARADVCGSCWRGSLCIAPNGDIHPCIMGKTWAFGNLTKGGLGAALASDELLRVRTAVYRELWSGAPCPPHGGCGPQHPCAPNCNPSCQPYGPCPPTCSPTCAPAMPCVPAARCIPG